MSAFRCFFDATYVRPYRLTALWAWAWAWALGAGEMPESNSSIRVSRDSRAWLAEGLLAGVAGSAMPGGRVRAEVWRGDPSSGGAAVPCAPDFSESPGGIGEGGIDEPDLEDAGGKGRSLSDWSTTRCRRVCMQCRGSLQECRVGSIYRYSVTGTGGATYSGQVICI